MQTLKRPKPMQITINIPDSFVDDFPENQNDHEIATLEKAFSLFLFHLKSTGNINHITKAYENLLKTKKINDSYIYESWEEKTTEHPLYTKEQIKGMKRGNEQALRGEFVPDEEMEAFFLDLDKKFDQAIENQQNAN